jgi:hypothetical protein
MWLRNTKRRSIILALAICSVVVVSAVVVYTAPLATVKILTINPHEEEVSLRVYLDGIFKEEVTAVTSSEYVVVAVWHVSTGTHVVEIDSGKFVFYAHNATDIEWTYEGPDAIIDSAASEMLYPFGTMNVEWYPSEEVDDSSI